MLPHVIMSDDRATSPHPRPSGRLFQEPVLAVTFYEDDISHFYVWPPNILRPERIQNIVSSLFYASSRAWKILMNYRFIPVHYSQKFSWRISKLRRGGWYSRISSDICLKYTGSSAIWNVPGPMHGIGLYLNTVTGRNVNNQNARKSINLGFYLKNIKWLFKD
jgi:hypothetical protein